MTITLTDLKTATLGVAIAAALTLCAPAAKAAETAKAYVAGGCFWCVESDFESVKGVGDVISGFTGGTTPDPVYQRSGDHIEAVEIPYDPEVVSYRQLIHAFFRSVDPLDGGGQFCDRGLEYTTAIFPSSMEEQKIAAEEKARAQRELGKPVKTKIIPFDRFYPVGNYHQDYYKSEDRLNRLSTVGINPKKKDAYKIYRDRCGRDQRVKQLWGDQAAFLK